MKSEGCLEYVTCDFTVHIAFPAKKVCCQFCEFCHSENGGSRFRCNVTGEILPYYNQGLGMNCPLPINLKNEGEDSND